MRTKKTRNLAETRKQILTAAFGEILAHGFHATSIDAILEKTELFARSLGETTDIVEKEMYTFPDRDGTLVTLRPEGTASVARALIEHHVGEEAKLYYVGPMFRHERPQKGRFRQFYQVGAELVGRDDPLADAELLLCLADLIEAVGVPHSSLLLNSLGDEECRPAYRAKLRAFLDSRRERLCANCVRRMERNPLRVLDCKEPGCREATADAPRLVDELCAPCAQHFARVRELLDEAGMAYELEPRLVRGLDYYIRTTFEVTAPGLGAQAAIAAGGRYDGLIAQLGGPALSCIGFACGVERLALAHAAAHGLSEIGAPGGPRPPDVFIAPLGVTAEATALGVARRIRRAGKVVELDGGRSLKSMMRRANRLGAPRVLIIGEEELAKRRGTLRDMRANKDEKLAVDLDLSGPELLAAVGLVPRNQA